jgi:ribosome-associated protein
VSERVDIPPGLLAAVEAARDKKAAELKVLDLRPLVSFTDFFVVATGQSGRQIQAVADAIVERLKQEGERPLHVEGYAQAEWVLLDYADFVVHIFSEVKRQFYDLERLWRDAAVVEVPEAAA